MGCRGPCHHGRAGGAPHPPRLLPRPAERRPRRARNGSPRRARHRAPDDRLPGPDDGARVHAGVARPRQSAVERRASDRRRAAWFRERLVEHGRAHIRPADPRDRRLQSASAAAGISFHLPITAAAIEIQIPFYYEFTLTGSATTGWYRNYDLCGHNPHTHDSWCRETWSGKWGESQSAGQWYLANDHRMVEGETVRARGELKSGGAYYTGTQPIKQSGGMSNFRQFPGKHVVPTVYTQTGNLQGTDYFYALYDPVGKQHTVISLTDPTINASIATGAKLAAENAVNGTCEEWWDNDWINTDRQLKETMLFLGAYDHETEIAGGAQLDETRPSRRAPRWCTRGTSPSPPTRSRSRARAGDLERLFGVGIFGDMATGSYDHPESLSASASVLVPSWEISPVPASARSATGGRPTTRFPGRRSSTTSGRS